MKPIRQAITLVFLMTLALAILGSVIFIGLGALLSLWLPFSLFQASCLATGAALTLALVIFALASIIHSHADHPLDPDILEWDPFDDDDDQMPFPEPAKPKIGRNAPCPCGSGRKYKNCCGKSSAP